MSQAPAIFKRLLLGRPMSSGELEHTLLPKAIALPVFASDPLSSNAYATQEILLVLGTAGVLSLRFVVPISIAVALLLTIVVTSYRQTVRAYPQGGGAYRVSRENLGVPAGLLAASALLLDYVLTVAVSIAAGVDAIVSARESLAPQRVEIALAFVIFIALMNLRGVKEAGVFFAIPTYGFVASMYLLIGTGIAKCLDGCPQAESADLDLGPGVALTAFVVLRAFSAGTTALTGVEAIADGVGAFRYPQSRNAATTLAIMGGLSITMFLGISWLADHTNVVYEHGERTVVAQIAHAVFGGGPLFYLVQIMTAAILILAANTAYQDFPRLSSILAGDNFMPRQFMNRGDRLVFSNGIVILSALAMILIAALDADVNSLIQLYLVGVFISFTLSQSGMVMRWRKLKGRNWRRSALINGFGATVTGIVFFVVVTTKFLGGAWVVIVAIPILMYAMHSVHKHYTDLAEELGHPERRPGDRRPGNQHMVLFVRQMDKALARAVGYARSIRPASLTAVTVDDTIVDEWRRAAPDIPIEVVKQGTSRTLAIRKHLRIRREELSDDDFLTLVVPEILSTRGLIEILLRPRLHRLKAQMVAEPGLQVCDVPVIAGEEETDVVPPEPARNYVIVLVSGVNNATLQAIEYAETLRPTDLRAVTFGFDPIASERVGNEWLRAAIPHPLEIQESPFRDIGRSLTSYVRQFRPDGEDRIVTVVIPEFVVSKRRHRLLHGQTALLVKRHLLFEDGVVVVSVPFHIDA